MQAFTMEELQKTISSFICIHINDKGKAMTNLQTQKDWLRMCIQPENFEDIRATEIFDGIENNNIIYKLFYICISVWIL